MGFTQNLKCSTCELLTKYELDPIKENCFKCCSKDESEAPETPKYPFAELVVCGWKLKRFPQVSAFIKSDRVRQFPNLKVRYAHGTDPIIRLMNEDREVVEILGIDKWNTDSVEEFFQEHLLQR